jgi:methylphosphotriester-DNA--protein-cysteine methyltransferase
MLMEGLRLLQLLQSVAAAVMGQRACRRAAPAICPQQLPLPQLQQPAVLLLQTATAALDSSSSLVGLHVSHGRKTQQYTVGMICLQWMTNRSRSA